MPVRPETILYRDARTPALFLRRLRGRPKGIKVGFRSQNVIYGRCIQPCAVVQRRKDGEEVDEPSLLSMRAGSTP